MKVTKVKYVGIEMTVEEAKTLYMICNWGDQVAELIGEKVVSAEKASSVSCLLDQLFNALDEEGIEEEE